MKIEKIRMLVLGPGGMLGQMVRRYFKGRVRELVPFAGRFESTECGRTVRDLAALRPDVVINCVGKIKQMTQNPGDLHYSNAVLPMELMTLLPQETIFVHPSTDCVFRGKATTPYLLTEPADAEDVYGWSKFLGERALLDRPQTLIPRVSIIGPDDRSNGPGLLNWFLRQADSSEVNGFTNHWWNGITTLEWCRKVERVLKEGELVSHDKAVLVQWGTPESVSKSALLKQVAQVFGREITVKEFASPEAVYRVLKPTEASQPICKQLQDLFSFQKLQ